MMEIRLFAIFVLFGSLLQAQTFLEVPRSLPFRGGDYGSVAFADIDGDQDVDIIVTGRNSTLKCFAKMFVNNGSGVFTEDLATPFMGVERGSIGFSDLDGDGDPDLLITGQVNSGRAIAKLYLNDGLGKFRELPGTPFEGVESSSIAFADVDGDKDQDILITGRSNSLERIAKLYRNDGRASFVEAVHMPFLGVDKSAIAFADVDGDTDLDLLITGQRDSGSPSAKLYINDGLGSFAEKESLLEGVEASAIAFADLDLDGDKDVLITGQTLASTPTSKLYTNDGTGNFSAVVQHPIIGVHFGSIAFADVDQDSDLDLLVSGQTQSATQYTGLYLNDGSADFIEVKEIPFEWVQASSVGFMDVDGDLDQDVYLMGQNSALHQTANLYINSDPSTPSKENWEESGMGFELYPNPAEEGNIHLLYASPEDGWMELSLMDINGKMLRKFSQKVYKGLQAYSLDVSSLSKGNYLIQLEGAEGKGTQKFSIQ
ncbi:MAG: T9SS type A sorting domain-containing protein [Bacteroidota bacterium]